MHAAADRPEFTPPSKSGLIRSFGLALLAHVVLLGALTWGVHWRSEPVTLTTATAELWSALPQQAAPKLVEVPPPPVIAPVTPPPPPKKAPPPEPPSAPVAPPPKPAPPKVEPKLPDPDIALAREKLRLKKEKQDALEKQQELEAQQLEKKRLEKIKQDKLQQDKLNQEKAALDKKRLEEKREQVQQEKDKQAAEDKKKAEQETKRKEAAAAQQEAKKQEAAQRQENLKRIAGLAGASGAPGATGSALKSSGPSAGYAGRIVASIKPNIVFADEIVGNPIAEVEVRTSPDGTILSRKLTKSSGDKSWDAAVLRAIDKTEKIPPDTDGRVPTSLTIVFRPRD